jgi:excisionase family DNA binding protein
MPTPATPATSNGTGLHVKFWKVAEAATLMRTSKMTVYRLLHSGELASVRVGRGFRIPEPALARYLDNATTPTPTTPTLATP